ncbi:hypothetical protein [Streptomyces goshikiensis]|uniref:hypothetical protein n=1 Tax=Streptomyces goshikiensis TaxID=1942 RepID=UPI00369831F0
MALDDVAGPQPDHGADGVGAQVLVEEAADEPGLTYGYGAGYVADVARSARASAEADTGGSFGWR